MLSRRRVPLQFDITPESPRVAPVSSSTRHGVKESRRRAAQRRRNLFFEPLEERRVLSFVESAWPFTEVGQASATGSGAGPGQPGGFTFSYDLSANPYVATFDQGVEFYWGPKTADLSLSGPSWSRNFTSADLVSSSPGQAIWQRNDIRLDINGDNSPDTSVTGRFVLSVTGTSLVSGASLPTGVATIGAAARITSSFTANFQFDVWNGATWVPADVYYQSASTGGAGSIKNVNNSGWYQNSPSLNVNQGVPGTGGDGTADSFLVTRVGSDIQVTANGNLIFALPASSVSAMTINGSNDNETLQVNLAGGDAIPAGGIAFSGGSQTSIPGDTLNITGGLQGDVTYNYTGANAGSVVMQNYGTVTYTGLEPITNTGTSNNVVLNLPGGSDHAKLLNIGSSTLRLVSTDVTPTFEQTDFAIPSGSVTVNGDSGVVAGLPTLLGTIAAGHAGEMDVNPNGDLVYVSEGMGGTGWSRINATNPAAMTITNLAGGFGGGVAVDPVTGRYASTNAYGSTLRVYNANDSVYDTESLIGCGGSLEAGNGTFAVSTQCIDRFHIYSQTSQSITLIASYGAPGSHIAYNGATDKYYWRTGTGNTAVYNESPAGFAGPLGGYDVVATNEVTNRLYAFNSSTGTLQVLDGSSHIPLATITGTTQDVAVDTVLDRVYTYVGGQIAVYNGAGTTFLGAIPLPAGHTPGMLDVAVGDDRLYAVAWSGGSPQLVVYATGSIVPGNDTLTVDFASSLNPIPASGIIFNGDGQTGVPGDKLIVDNVVAGSATLNHTDAHSGSVALSGLGTINYTGLEPVEFDNSTITSLTVNLPNTNDSTDDNTELRISGSDLIVDSLNGEHEDDTVSLNGITSLVINGRDGDDTIALHSSMSAFAGAITIDGGAQTDDINVNAALSLGANNLAVTGETIDVNAVTITTSSGNQTYTGLLGLVGSQVGTTGSGSVILGGNVAVTGSAASTLSGKLDLGGTTRTFTVADVTGSAATDLAIPADVSNGFMTKAGAGLLALSGANSFGGTAMITAGTLQVSGGFAIADSTSIQTAGGVFDLAGSTETVASVYGSSGSVSLGTGGLLIVAAPAATNSSYDASITGAGSVTLNGDATASWGLRGNNTYTGTTTVQGGTLILQNGAAIADTAAVDVRSYATLRLNSSETIGALSGATESHIQFNSNTLTTGDATDTVFAGSMVSTGGVTNLIKQGSGTLTLSGASTYSGDTTINNGRLLVNGSITSTVTVNGSGTLGGIGFVGAVQSNGTVAPGNSPGILNTGDVSLTGGSLAIEIGGPNAGNSAADHDQLNVSGTVALGAGVAKLLLSGAYTPAAGDDFVIIANNGVSDFTTGYLLDAANNPLHEGAAISFNSRTLFLTYNGGDGNDVVLQTTAVVNGTDGGDTITITPQAMGGLSYVLNSNPAVVLPGPLASFTFNGQGGDDLMTVLLNANTLPSGGILYNGEEHDTPLDQGANNVHGDVLRVVGDSTQTATYLPDGSVNASLDNDGVVTVAGQGAIHFTGLEPVDMQGLAVANIQLPNGADLLTVTAGVDAATNLQAALIVAGTSGGVSFEPVHLRGNAQIVVDTVTGGADGVDSVTFQSVSGAHGNSAMSLNLGANQDVISFAPLADPVAVSLTARGTTDGFAGTTTLAAMSTTIDNVDQLTGSSASGSGAAGDTLTLTLSAAAIWNVTAANAGDVSVAGPARDLDFTSFENLVGGALSDSFIMGATGSLNGGINGGKGADFIDYSAYSTTISVDLTATPGTATNVTGGLAVGSGGDVGNSIEHVYGGSGADTIVGDADVNIIRGNAGADTINAKDGIDDVNGGAGNDLIQIAGTEATDDLILGGPGGVEDPTDYDIVRNVGAGPATLHSFNSAFDVFTNSIDRYEGAGFTLQGNASGNGLHLGFTEVQNTPVVDGGLGNDSITTSHDNDVATEASTGYVLYDGGDGTDHVTLVLTPDQFGALTTAEILTLQAYVASPSGKVLTVTEGNLKGNFRAQNFETAAIAVYDDDIILDITSCFAAIVSEDQIVVGTMNADSIVGTHLTDLIFGQDGDDTLYGLDASDCLFGGAGMDLIYGGNLNDKILGGSGDDLLYGGADEDIVLGGSGNDSIFGEYGHDRLEGGSGNDYLDGGGDHDTLNGGVGLDTVLGGDLPDVIQIRGDEALNDVMNGGESTDTLEIIASGGTATLAGFSAGAASIELIAGNGQGLQGTGAANTFDLSVIATPMNLAFVDGLGGDDTLIGSQTTDLLRGGEGNDRLIGNLGFDLLEGGPGADYLDGGLHDDTLDGGPGVDTVLGGAGYDILRVRADEAANDMMNGGENTDTVVNMAAAPVVLAAFNAGTSLLEGWVGNNQPIVGDDSANVLSFLISTSYSMSLSGVLNINGLGGDDTITGTFGVDTIYGGDGNDTILGLGGTDYLYGETGNDSLNGGDGVDHLYGGDGTDTITTGAGRDVTYFADDLATMDVITDFALYSDSINLRAYGVTYATLGFDRTSIPGSTIIQLNSTSPVKRIRLLNWNRVVTSSQFVF
jgi:autotransporter-associated beta strand protein